MIPKLYEKVTANTVINKTNYIGVLNKCTKCEVTEVRNGAYTLSLETTVNDEFYFGLDWHVSTHFTKIYRSLSQEVFNQLYRLPGYNDWLMYQITLNTRSFRDLKNN